MTHPDVWFGTLTCVIWPIHMCDAMCDMTDSHVWHVWYEPFTCLPCVMCVTWLVEYVCDMSHSCVWHESFRCATWLMHLCDVTRWVVIMYDRWVIMYYAEAAPWRIHMCGPFICVTHSHVWLTPMCDMTHSCVWCDAFLYVTHSHVWPIHVCAIPLVRHDSFLMCGMTSF